MSIPGGNTRIPHRETEEEPSGIWQKKGGGRRLWNMSPNKVENTKQPEEMIIPYKGINIGGNKRSTKTVWWKLYIERVSGKSQGDASKDEKGYQ